MGKVYRAYDFENSWRIRSHKMLGETTFPNKKIHIEELSQIIEEHVKL